MATGRPAFVVLGAAGGMGRGFAVRFAAEADLVGVDLVAPRSPEPSMLFVQMDVCQPALERSEVIRRADVVLVCLPESVALRIAADVLGLMRPHTLWVDTLSVKTPIVTTLVSAGRDDVEALSINPLFGPSVDPQGQCVLAVPVREGPRSHRFFDMLRRWGVSVERLSAEEHDRHTSAIQVLAHATLLAFGRALQAIGYDLSDRPAATTPPMRTLLALLARLSSLNPHVYWDIQAANPCATEARAALIAATRELEQAVRTGNQASLDAIAHSTATVLGAYQEQYHDLCAQIFSVDTSRTINTH